MKSPKQGSCKVVRGAHIQTHTTYTQRDQTYICKQQETYRQATRNIQNINNIVQSALTCADMVWSYHTDRHGDREIMQHKLHPYFAAQTSKHTTYIGVERYLRSVAINAIQIHTYAHTHTLASHPVLSVHISFLFHEELQYCALIPTNSSM